jgi:hypothetical protein
VCARVSSGNVTCVEPTDKGIVLASTQRDVMDTDEPELKGRDSELDETVDIFDLERLDFEDETGLEEDAE